MRFGAVWPQPMLQSAATTGFGQTHPHVDAHTHIDTVPVSGHAASATHLGHIDTSAGARAVQQQLADVRTRATS